MGYHVTIARPGGPPITAAEVVALVARRADLRTGTSPDGSLWLAHARIDADPAEPVLFHDPGALWAKNPDALMLELIVGVARDLAAEARGDEGEPIDDDAVRAMRSYEAHPPPPQHLPWWRPVRGLRGRLLLLAGGIGLGLAASVIAELMGW
jgi:hypothetical protein